MLPYQTCRPARPDAHPQAHEAPANAEISRAHPRVREIAPTYIRSTFTWFSGRNEAEFEETVAILETRNSTRRLFRLFAVDGARHRPARSVPQRSGKNAAPVHGVRENQRARLQQKIGRTVAV